MGFFSRNSKAGASDMGEVTELKNKLSSCESELGAANLKIQALNGKLSESEEKYKEVCAELERLQLQQKSAGMSPEQKKDLMEAELKSRDDKINQLTKQIEQLNQEMEDQVGEINKKMLLVLNDKDHQIKRLNALGDLEAKEGGLRTAISAETAKKLPGKLPTIQKSPSEKKSIEGALMANTFMRGLSCSQMEKLIDAMEKKHYQANVEIIREGQDGTHMYILEKGEVNVSKGVGAQKTNVCDLGAGTLFGELAILYNCRRTATIKTKTNVTLWCLERSLFQIVVKSAGQEKDQERYQLISSVQDFEKLPEAKLHKICDCLEEEYFENGSCIIRQGTKGDLFFIIQSGEVRITVEENGDEKEVAKKSKGEYFGEIALQREDVRSANVYAKGPVVCLTLDRTAFTNLVGKLSDDHVKDDKVDQGPRRVIDDCIKNAQFADLDIIKALGAGGFGLVKLVKVKGITDRAYALKCIQKARVVQYGQQRHIMDEKNILLTMQSPFILGLLRTFKDKKFVYLLTDAYLGGDLWRTLHARGPFNDTVARFYVACVIEAFDYLHKRHYCYRDLKPENLMVDNNGYVRMVDLGFAKLVPPGHKTWTFCGTPEYIPPEIISNTGHNYAADYWSLGILIFELLSKRTPFRAKDDMAIYEGILRGIHSVQFPYKISRKAESLIKQLCRQDPSERIGYQKSGVNDIRKHRWFQGFDWDALQAERLTAPHLPEIKNPFDVSNFEKIREEDERKVPEETSGWDKEF